MSLRVAPLLTGLALLAGSATAAAAQAGSIGAMLFPGTAPPPAAAPAPAATASPTVGPSAPTGPAPAEAGRPARARPLFSATRRPPPVSVAAAVEAAPVIEAPPPPPSPPPQLRLVGIVEGIDRPLALLRGEMGERTRTVRVGDRIEAWEVVRIEAGGILLRDGDREQDYQIFAKEAAPGSVAAPFGTASPVRPMMSGASALPR
ncbi:hypothetical protein [Methylobacterium sp. ID0610]|uniref:hypothetical protein n=1 Tax=Methylobacterium carpenticola TaxID=3344827 RepID=UPI0036A81DC0